MTETTITPKSVDEAPVGERVLVLVNRGEAGRLWYFGYRDVSIGWMAETEVGLATIQPLGWATAPTAPVE